MCGRFYIDPDDMTDAELIELLNRERIQAESSGNEVRTASGEVRPGDFAGVIAMNLRLQRAAFVMQWGFSTGKSLVINARSESAAEKPMFRHSMRDRRCLIPASAYFEWDHRQRPYQKYRFAIEGQRMLYLGGIYRFEERASLPVFTILTREASPDIAGFHPRMPVIIPADMSDVWLDRTCTAESLLENAITHTVWNKVE